MNRDNIGARAHLNIIRAVIEIRDQGSQPRPSAARPPASPRVDTSAPGSPSSSFLFLSPSILSTPLLCAAVCFACPSFLAFSIAINQTGTGMPWDGCHGASSVLLLPPAPPPLLPRCRRSAASRHVRKDERRRLDSRREGKGGGEGGGEERHSIKRGTNAQSYKLNI